VALLDAILKSALGSNASAQQEQSLLEGVIEFLDRPETGGITGLQQTFDSNGLGSLISSWIGTGANQPISPSQLESAFGGGGFDQLARKAGVSTSQIPSILAMVLPALIDKLTPDGNVPSRPQLAERQVSILESLRSAMGSSAAGAGAKPQSARPDFSNVQSGSSTTRMPTQEPVAAAKDEMYTVVSGDSLSKIAKRFYGNANDWRRIFEANRDQIKDPDLIRPGQKLRVPRA
jgi:uncharacterized protein YidB (DUF937 family)